MQQSQRFTQGSNGGRGGGYEFDKTMLSFDSAKLLLFSYSYSMLNETEMEIAIQLLALALNNNNNIKIYTCTYNNYYENYLRFQKG